MRLDWLWLSLSLLVSISLARPDSIEFDINAENSEAEIDNSLSSQYERLSNDSLLWGPYRSSLYFGLRPRLPRSLLSGLMWFNADGWGSIGTFRHFYEQGDNMDKANWVQYDPRFGGRQIINDKDCHINIVIDFVKSSDGQSWGVKVKSEPHEGHENVKTGFVWYSGMEGVDRSQKTPIADEDDADEIGSTSYFRLDNDKNVVGHSGDLKFSGISSDLGLFELEINDGPKTNKHPTQHPIIDPELDPSKTHHYSLVVPDDNVWKAKDIFMTLLQESVQELLTKHGNLEQFAPEQAFILRDLQNFEGNLHYVQKMFEGRAEFDIVFNNAITPDHERITFANIGDKINVALRKFDKKFDQHFQLNKPFNHKKYEVFSKEIVSGLLGGLSYFYGDHLVDRETVFDEDSFESHNLVGQSEGPHELFTLVPSRPFFPRGFYWDEGFHLLPLLEYDSDLVLEIVKSWFNLIDDEGWIAREQILGPESRSRVPEQFQVQSPEIVNPPTLMLIFSYLLENLRNSELGDLNEPVKVREYGGMESLSPEDLGSIVVDNPAVLMNFTRQIYPKLKLHFDKFRRTQQGYVEEFDRGSNLEAYRWRGRTLTHTLASGIDDYPRALPADIAELNVDLLSWIGVMTRSIKLIAELLDYKDDYEHFATIEHNIVRNLNDLHWSDEHNTYCDLSVNEDDENVYVCHKGYISLFPFLTKLMPADDVERLEHLVNLIADPEELWSDYGIRSLSKSDQYYSTAENYWRSPIWININYLVLESLQHYKTASRDKLSPALSDKISATYTKLRTNLVDNIFRQWKQTGFVWEQYDDTTGQAKGAKNFLGWTSSVAVMMSMPEKI